MLIKYSIAALENVTLRATPVGIVVSGIIDSRQPTDANIGDVVYKIGTTTVLGVTDMSEFDSVIKLEVNNHGATVVASVWRPNSQIGPSLPA